MAGDQAMDRYPKKPRENKKASESNPEDFDVATLHRVDRDLLKANLVGIN